MLKLRRCLLLAVLLAVPVRATTVKRLDLDGLVSTAETIVVGEVLGSETYWTLDRRVILTRHTILVDETLKGAVEETIEVTIVGGTIGDIVLYVAGMPAFTAGERTVLFLESSSRYRTVVGLGQGKFRVDGDFIANEVSELEFSDGRPASPTRMPFAQFREEIRQRLDR